MKKIFSTFTVFLGLLSYSIAQNVNIPDAKFKAALLAHNPKIDTDDNSEISLSEAQAFNGSIDALRKEITSLVGIEAFVNITVLYCYGNSLTSLDVSKNTKLQQLICNDNQLTSLDVTKNTALTNLSCGENPMLPFICVNPSQITTTWKKDATAEFTSNCAGETVVVIPDAKFKSYILAITPKIDANNDKLIQVSEAATYNGKFTVPNGVTTLKGIDAFVNLTALDCRINNIKSLDLSKNSALTELLCSQNELTTLDLSKNTALVTLNCRDNQLTTLDLSQNKNLVDLNCGSNPIASLDVTNSTALKILKCNDTQLTSLDVSKNINLTELILSNNSLTSLDVTKNTLLVTLKCDHNQILVLDVSQNTALQLLDCTSVSDAGEVENGRINRNQLSNLDVSKNTALTSLNCAGHQLTSLDVTKNTALTSLACDNNQLMNLDVSLNTLLTDLNCGFNQITTIDISKNIALTYLQITENKITSLDVSKNVALENLTCDYNLLTVLDVSKNLALTFLYCIDNPNLKIICIDAVHSNIKNSWWKDETAVFSGNCSYNLNITDANFYAALLAHSPTIDTNNDGKIQEVEAKLFTGKIDVSNKNITSLFGIQVFENLTGLDCSNNQLTSLNLPLNKKLTFLNCANNPFITQTTSGKRTQNSVSIDLSQNLDLVELNCSNTNLTDLDLSNHVLLKKLDCSKNPLLKEIFIQLSIINQDFIKDETAEWKSPIITAFDDANTTKNTVIKAYNLQGMEIPKETKGQIIILLYSNGTSKKVIQE